MVQLKVASMFFFSGLAVVIALVAVVYVVAWIYDRASGAPEALLTQTELEERRVASTMVKEAGLAGLLPDEKNRVVRHFFQGKSSAYIKQHDIETPPDRDVVVNGNRTISSPTEDERKSSKKGSKDDTAVIANSNIENPTKKDKSSSNKRRSKKTPVESSCCNCDKEDKSESKQNNSHRCIEGPGCSCCEDSNDLDQASKSSKQLSDNGKKGNETESPGDNADEDTEEGGCPICLVEFEVDENVIIGSSCGHLFHFECLMQWFEKNHSDCPLCRSDMMTAENFLASAYEVLGDQRVNKLKHINEQAARRLEALEANRHHHREETSEDPPHAGQPSTDPVDPPVGRDPPARLAPTATADTSRLTVVMVQ